MLVEVLSCYNRWEEVGPCKVVSRLYNSVVYNDYLSNINFHSWICCSVCDCITSGLDAKIVDPDSVLHSSCLRAQFANQVSPLPSVPLEGWTSSLQQLLPFNYVCLYAHLVTDSKTIAEDQHCSCYIWSWCNEAQRGRISLVT